MNIKQVGYFVAVFDSGSFSVAARSRSVTVQAVSKAIHELEQEFSTRFFVRSSQGVTPTATGCAFYQKARPAIEAFEALQAFDASASDEASEAMPPEKGGLSIGLCAPVFASSDSLCRTLEAFLGKGTGVEVGIATVDPRSAAKELSRSRLDALVTVGDYESPETDCVRVGTLPTGIVVAKNHPLVKAGVAHITDLEQYPAGVSPVFDSFNRSILTEYRSRGLLKNLRTVEALAEDDVAFMRRDLGFFFSAILPVPTQFGDEFVLVPIDQAEGVDVPICLVSLKDKKSAQYQTVEAFLIQAISSLGKTPKSN